MNAFDTFRETSELAGSRFADCPLGKVAKDASESVSMEEYDEPSKPMEKGLENIYDEIYNRDIDEFTFDEFDLDNESLREELARFEPGTWKEMDSYERQIAVSGGLAWRLAEILDLKREPKIIFFDGAEYECGSYNAATNVIELNKNRLDNPKELVNTVAHEMWHAYQHQCARNPETRKDALYVVNFENYIRPEQMDGNWVLFEEYESQLVEAEASAFGRLLEEKAGENNEYYS